MAGMCERFSKTGPHTLIDCQTQFIMQQFG